MSKIKEKIMKSDVKNPVEAHELYTKLKGYESLKNLSDDMLKRELAECKELDAEGKAVIEAELEARAKAREVFLAKKAKASQPEVQVDAEVAPEA